LLPFFASGPCAEEPPNCKRDAEPSYSFFARAPWTEQGCHSQRSVQSLHHLHIANAAHIVPDSLIHGRLLTMCRFIDTELHGRAQFGLNGNYAARSIKPFRTELWMSRYSWILSHHSLFFQPSRLSLMVRPQELILQYCITD